MGSRWIGNVTPRIKSVIFKFSEVLNWSILTMSDLMQFSVKAGYLCPRCRSIFAEPDHAPGQYPSRTSYETISTTKAFEDMAREGCFICHRLLKSYEKSRHELVELLQFRYQFVRDRPMYAWVEIELRSRDRTSILARKMVSLLHVKDHCKAYAWPISVVMLILTAIQQVLTRFEQYQVYRPNP